MEAHGLRRRAVIAEDLHHVLVRTGWSFAEELTETVVPGPASLRRLDADRPRAPDRGSGSCARGPRPGPRRWWPLSRPRPRCRRRTRTRDRNLPPVRARSALAAASLREPASRLFRRTRGTPTPSSEGAERADSLRAPERVCRLPPPPGGSARPSAVDRRAPSSGTSTTTATFLRSPASQCSLCPRNVWSGPMGKESSSTAPGAAVGRTPPSAGGTGAPPRAPRASARAPRTR